MIIIKINKKKRIIPIQVNQFGFCRFEFANSHKTLLHKNDLTNLMPNNYTNFYIMVK